MRIENLPFCCTAAVLGSFGEHGEPSVVNLKEIERLVNSKLIVERDLGGHVVAGPKRLIIATSVDPENVAMLLAAGFQVVDKYDGIQGVVHVLTLHC